MPMVINVGQKLVPNVNKRNYRLTTFKDGIQLPGYKGVLNIDKVTRSLNASWNFIRTQVAHHKPCNDYFQHLSAKKTLLQILNEGDITLHCLWPKEDTNELDVFIDKVPYGTAAGRDIGINPYLL